MVTRLPILVVGAWLAVTGAAIWSYAAVETEPPAFDAYSYAVKAFEFWNAVDRGQLFNPLNLDPTLRPPGTVLMSYPFGFSHAFNAYYFRSMFLPILLLAVAIYVACYQRSAERKQSWITAVIALSACSMPAFYQFQADTLPAVNFWGLVDAFMAGVAAVAVAAAIRSVRDLSAGWAMGAALAAALCLMIKPAGALVMASVGATWLILLGFATGWNPRMIWHKPAIRRFALNGVAGAAIVFGLTITAALSSFYLSPTNITLGQRTIELLHSNLASVLALNFFVRHITLSFGYVVPILTGIGLILTSVTPRQRGHAAAAIVCLTLGSWFWLIETSPSQARYFFPFGFMAFVLVAPSIRDRLRTLPVAVSASLSVVMVAPTIAVTVLMLTPHPSDAWERALKVNLTSGAFRAENQQAADFLKMVQREGARTVYIFPLGSPARNFGAVVNYWNYFDPQRVRTKTKLPIDWVHSTTFRLDDIRAADFVAFEPVTDEAAREAALQVKTATDFGAESKLFQAWFSTLGVDDGVAIVSETRLRLLRIVDHVRFGLALDRLSHAYDWRPVFREANP